MTDTSSKTVERFDPFATYGDHATMCRASDGDYVSYTDYAALFAKLELSEGALDICSKSWGECNAKLDAANSRLAAAWEAVALARDNALVEAAESAAGWGEIPQDKFDLDGTRWNFDLPTQIANRILALRTSACDTKSDENVPQAASVELCDELVDVMHKGEWPTHDNTKYRRADLPPTAEQIMADLRVKALVDAVGPLLSIVDALSAESGRCVEYGEEDAFRYGEWFEHEDMQNIEQARAALAKLKEPKS